MMGRAHGRWRDQYDRVLRWHQRLAEIDRGTYVEDTAERLADDIVAFFQNCYHLKDWLKNDTSYSYHSSQEIESRITATPVLALCADICNGTKHFVFDQKKSPRSGSEPLLSGRVYHSTIGGEADGLLSLKVRIEHNGTEHDAFELASKCVECWNQFLGDAAKS